MNVKEKILDPKMIKDEARKCEVSFRDNMSKMKAYCKVKRPVLVVTTATILWVASMVCLGWFVAHYVLKRDGGWGEWTSWSICLDDCTQTRSRLCDNPTPVLLGKDCIGYKNQNESCSGGYCRGESDIFYTDMNQLSL